MIKDDIIRMAKEAGFDEWESHCLSGNSELDRTFAVGEYPCGEEVFKFAELIAAAEREECAKLCEKADRYRGDYFAAQIRARITK
jgi:hypothetical protein